jgi:hypothetical protein
MDSQWRNLFSAFALAAAVATPAVGQTVVSAGAYGGSESADSIPDLSGFWVHPLPGFEPLASGPTALVNRSRRLNGTGDILKLTGDYTNPILKPEAGEVVKRHAELGLNGIGDPNPRNQCWPAGVPFVFTNGPTQLLQQPDRVTILYGYDHQVRRVRLNKPHPAQITPSWYGDSVGHYEGDTLWSSIPWASRSDGIQWSTGTAHRIRRLFTSSNDIGYSTPKAPKKALNATQSSTTSARG